MNAIHLHCDACGREARRPAITLALRVFCTRCAPEAGMDPGEHNRDVRSYEEWKALAARAQQALAEYYTAHHERYRQVLNRSMDVTQALQENDRDWHAMRAAQTP